MTTYKIATIAGDGIGKEIMPEAIKVLEAIAQVHGGLRFDFNHFPYGSDYYVKNGSMMAEDGLEKLADSDAVFLGAVGDPSIIPDHISLWGLLIKIRRGFEQEINLRPAKFLQALETPLHSPKDFDMLIVRQNSEGEYSEVGGRIYQGADEIAIQNNIFSKKATEKAMRYAFDLAKGRKKHVTSATKSNGIVHTMPFWDEVFQEIAADYPDIATSSQHIDALAAHFVTQPEKMDVIVASNLFGDILSDIGAAIMGSIGIAPSGNINVNGKYPSMFEPVHGSAPDIYGKGIANPLGQIWTGKMMLDHFGLYELGQLLLTVMEEAIQERVVTPDLGGKYATSEVSAYIIEKLKK